MKEIQVFGGPMDGLVLENNKQEVIRIPSYLQGRIQYLVYLRLQDGNYYYEGKETWKTCLKPEKIMS